MRERKREREREKERERERKRERKRERDSRKLINFKTKSCQTVAEFFQLLFVFQNNCDQKKDGKNNGQKTLR